MGFRVKRSRRSPPEHSCRRYPEDVATKVSISSRQVTILRLHCLKNVEPRGVRWLLSMISQARSNFRIVSIIPSILTIGFVLPVSVSLQDHEGRARFSCWTMMPEGRSPSPARSSRSPACRRDHLIRQFWAGVERRIPILDAHAFHHVVELAHVKDLTPWMALPIFSLSISKAAAMLDRNP